jgi:hypothetical protein
MESSKIRAKVEEWIDLINSACRKTTDAESVRVCTEAISDINLLMDLLERTDNANIGLAMLIAIECIVYGGEFTRAMGSLADAIVSGKSVLITEPQMMGPVVGSA